MALTKLGAHTDRLTHIAAPFGWCWMRMSRCVFDFVCAAVLERGRNRHITFYLSNEFKCHFQIDQTAIQLIDIGKVIHVDSLRDQKMYHLTPAAKLTPVRANLCKIEKVINLPLCKLTHAKTQLLVYRVALGTRPFLRKPLSHRSDRCTRERLGLTCRPS